MFRDRPEMSIELPPRMVADYLKYNRRSGDSDTPHAYVRMVRGGQDGMRQQIHQI